jgi:hypothetical protein
MITFGFVTLGMIALLTAVAFLTPEARRDGGFGQVEYRLNFIGRAGNLRLATRAWSEVS